MLLWPRAIVCACMCHYASGIRVSALVLGGLCLWDSHDWLYCDHKQYEWL